MQDKGNTERTLVAEVILCRRAMRSHSKILATMTNKYLEVRDITVGLKKIIQGTGKVISVGNLHSTCYRCLGIQEPLLFNNSHPRQ